MKIIKYSIQNDELAVSRSHLLLAIRARKQTPLNFVIFDVKKIKNFINGDLPKEFQGYPQSRNFKFFLYICVIVMRDIGIYRVIRLYQISAFCYA